MFFFIFSSNSLFCLARALEFSSAFRSCVRRERSLRSSASSSSLLAGSFLASRSSTMRRSSLASPSRIASVESKVTFLCKNICILFTSKFHSLGYLYQIVQLMEDFYIFLLHWRNFTSGTKMLVQLNVQRYVPHHTCTCSCKYLNQVWLPDNTYSSKYMYLYIHVPETARSSCWNHNQMYYF